MKKKLLLILMSSFYDLSMLYSPPKIETAVKDL